MPRSRRWVWRPPRVFLEALERRDAPAAAPIVAPTPPTSPIVSIEWRGQRADVFANEWLVQFDGIHGSRASQVDQISARLAQLGPQYFVKQHLGSDGLALIKGPSGASFDAVRNALAPLSGRANLEPNFVVTPTMMPTDPNFNLQYGLHNVGQTIQGQAGIVGFDVDAPEAWDVTLGSSSVVVGVIDTGVDVNHPDLAANVFVNPGEIAGNGIDDDGNGFVDDVNGWDFADDDNTPQDAYGHGTHVAGIIAASGNDDVGVIGMAPQIKIVPIKFINGAGQGSLAGAIAAIYYASDLHDQGIPIVLTNNSWGAVGAYSSFIEDAISEHQARNMLFVTGAGNSGGNNDVTPYYPASHPQDNIVSVAASDNRDQRWFGSQYGLTTVDIAAPGVEIYSTMPVAQGSYGYKSGTSMAAPLVAGAAALLWSVKPSATYAEIRNAILSGGDPIAAFATSGPTPIATGKRLNVASALYVLAHTPTVTSVAPFVGPTSGGNVVVITGTNFSDLEPDHLPGAVKFGGVDAVSYTVNSATQITAVAPAGSPATVDVRVTDAIGTSDTTSAADDYTYAAPAIVSVEINGGEVVARNKSNVAPSIANQHSIVAQILVTFNQKVKLDEGAFTITPLAVTSQGATASMADVAVVATGVPETGDDDTGYVEWVLTFAAGAGVNVVDNATGHAGNVFTVLKDGIYQFNTIGAKVHAGPSDTAEDSSDPFWALFGAFNPGDVKITSTVGGGDDTLFVDGLALTDAYATFGSAFDVSIPPYVAAFDGDLDGDVDGIDLARLYANFGTIWYF